MGVRRQAREAALQALFMCDALGSWDIGSVRLCFNAFGIPKPVRSYAFTLASGVIENLGAVDAKISCASEHWSLSRMARVDRVLLRLTTFELIYLDDIPTNVAIDEAIEIAKRFSAENSPTFVNGVLDQIAGTLRDKVEVVKEPPKESDDRAPEDAIAILEQAEADIDPTG